MHHIVLCSSIAVRKHCRVVGRKYLPMEKLGLATSSTLKGTTALGEVQGQRASLVVSSHLLKNFPNICRKKAISLDSPIFL